MKIAVIGSGISGMTSAHLLSEKHEVHMFEADQRIGGHTNTLCVTTNSGQYNIDTGFIVFNDRNYPNFIKLMQKLGVPSKPSEMSFSVKCEKNGLEYNGTSINSLFCQRRNFFRPSFYQMIFDILRFNKEATKYYLEETHQFGDKTLENYLRENRYSEDFIEQYIMPMGAAIWSASREEMRAFPLHFFVRFFHHHGMLTVDDRPKWRVLEGGSKSYIPKLTANFKERIHLSTPVIAVETKSDHVLVTTQKKGDSPVNHIFDEVIFSCHADQTKKMLTNPSEQLKKVMSGFSYRPNDVILHTDDSVLPQSKLGHASWNYFLPKTEKERVAVTYHMNILQGIKSPESFLVSLNMEELIDPKKILAKIPYSHPVYNLEAVRSQGQWETISGHDHLHFCGAYWGNGFHEDGVKSALKVTASMGVNL